MVASVFQQYVLLVGVLSVFFVRRTISSDKLPSYGIVRDAQSAVLPSGGIFKSSPMKNSFPKWSMTMFKDKLPVGALKEIETGFDFTEDEMKKFKLWPRAIIPYYIDDFSYDKVLRDRIRSFLASTNEVAGLNFVELASPPTDAVSRWVFFVNRVGKLDCSDHTTLNMTNENAQRVVLGYDCMCNGGELAEAVLSIAGVPPQHNAPNRNAYITVEMDNILPDKRYLFQQLKNDEWLFHDLDYDFFSAGHFNFHKHTISGSATIKPTMPMELHVGEGGGFSYFDIVKIRMLYNYISKKKDTDAAAPECQKLFKPGSQFSKFKPVSSEDKEMPRVKPNRYLGKPDEIPAADEYVPRDPIQNPTKSDDENVDVIERSAESNNDTDIEEKKSHEEQNNTDQVQGMQRQKIALKVPLSNVSNRDPLNALSDYHTDDNLGNRLYKKKYRYKMRA